MRVAVVLLGADTTLERLYHLVVLTQRALRRFIVTVAKIMMSNVQLDKSSGQVAMAAGCRLCHPSQGDWDRWRAFIIRQYIGEGLTAPKIVQTLRDAGFQVTYATRRAEAVGSKADRRREKMLRDRLRIWRANTKISAKKTTQTCVFSTPRLLSTRDEEYDFRHLLRELDRWLELAWQQKDKHLAAKTSVNLVSVLSDFYSLSMVAVNTGSPRAWSRLHTTLASAASLDLQSLTPSQIGAVVMDPPEYCHESVILDASDTFSATSNGRRTELRQTRMLLKQALSQRLSGNHPLLLLLEYRASDKQAMQLYYAASQIDQCKIMQHESLHRRDRSIAEARYRLASFALHFEQHRMIRDALGCYETDEDGHQVPDVPRCFIHTLLGRSHLAEERFVDAHIQFERADRYDDGKDPISSIYVAKYGAKSLLSQGKVVEAVAWLWRLEAKLALALTANWNDVDLECITFDIRCLCNQLRGPAELEDVLDDIMVLEYGFHSKRHLVATAAVLE